MSKADKYKKVKNGMHRDFVGKFGILINRNGATVIVDENSITDSELDNLYNRYK